jgi:mannose-6-phosphate isomerase-like protein (cupin superfamily)
VHAVVQTLATAPELVICAETTREEVAATRRRFGRMDDRELGGRRFRGLSPWERHPFDDELLYTQDGEAEITLLTEAGAVSRRLTAGTLFVVPKGAWHRLRAPLGATIWGATQTAHDEISFAEDPRAEPR